MKMILYSLATTLFAFPMVTMAATTFVNGSSPELAWYSPRFIQISTGSIMSGIYWYDELQGLGTPFQAYADGFLDGGGYTLALVSLDSAPTPNFTISSNTGTVSAPFITSHTRNVAYLALNQDARIMYHVRSGGSTIFLGSYVGRFNDITPFFTSVITNTMGLNGQLGSTYDFHRADRNYDVSIFVREINTPAPRAVPEPSTAVFLLVGTVALARHRRRKIIA